MTQTHGKRIGFVDFTTSERSRFPSPSLLRVAAARHAAGDTVTHVNATAVATADVDQLVVLIPPWRSDAARSLLAECTVEVETLDPWSYAPDSVTDLGTDALAPKHDLIKRACQGDADLAPDDAPVHPWVVASAAPANVGSDESRLRAAIGGLTGMHTTSLVAGDERVRLTQDRVVLLAELVSESIRSRKSLVEITMRVWPEDLMQPQLVDHLSMLPITSLDLLVGSLRQASLDHMNAPTSVAELEGLVAALAASGLAQATTLSLVAGLPGETIEDSVAVLDSALKLVGEHNLPGIRIALWFGPGGPPRNQEEQTRRFVELHPEWSMEEYRGFHDLVAVIGQSAPNIRLVGPGFLPSWDAVP